MFVQARPVHSKSEGKEQFFNGDAQDKNMGQVAKVPVQLHILGIKRKDAPEINEVKYREQDSPNPNLSIKIGTAVKCCQATNEQSYDATINVVERGKKRQNDKYEHWYKEYVNMQTVPLVAAFAMGYFCKAPFKNDIVEYRTNAAYGK